MGQEKYRQQSGYCRQEQLQNREPEKKPPVLTVLAANETYVPVLYTCLQSAIRHTTPGRIYQFLILHTDISLESQELFQAQLACGQITIRFVNVAKKIAGYQLKAKMHITEETFYRFCILDVCKNQPKAVYLDCDTIVCRDLAQLYDTPLGHKLAAAVKDADFAGQCNRKDSGMRGYSRRVLGLKNPFGYFQAGVLVLNVEGLRKVTSVRKLLELAERGDYRFSDQDILNRVCQGRVKYLDMAWNVLHDCGHSRRAQVIRYAPDLIAKEYEAARKEPYIIHYAGFPKPWIRPDEDFAYEFWKVARETVVYRRLLEDLCRQKDKGLLQSGRKAWINRIKTMVKHLLPQGSRIRNYAAGIYLRLILKASA